MAVLFKGNGIACIIVFLNILFIEIKLVGERNIKLVYKYKLQDYLRFEISFVNLSKKFNPLSSHVIRDFF